MCCRTDSFNRADFSTRSNSCPFGPFVLLNLSQDDEIAFVMFKLTICEIRSVCSINKKYLQSTSGANFGRWPLRKAALITLIIAAQRLYSWKLSTRAAMVDSACC